MKKLIWLAVLFVSAFSVAQPKVDFLEGQLPDIFKIAKTENKPVMLMGYATWCSHCNLMKSTVLIDPAVSDFFNKNFICTQIDGESADGIAMRKRYNVKAFPTFLFLDSNGELLYTASGEFTAENFIKEGQNALSTAHQLPELKKLFESDMNNADFALAYVSALRKHNQNTDAAAQQYLSKLTDQQLISEMNWRIIAQGVRDINSREFRFVLKKQPEFAAVASKKRVDKKIINAVQEWLQPFVEANDTVNYFKKRSSAANIGLFKTDSLIFNYDLQILESTKNWDGYHKAAVAGVEKFASKNAWQLKEIARVYMNHISAPKALDQAIIWAKRSLELQDAYDIRVIIARLYLNRKDMKNAKEWAENAKTMAESYNFDNQPAVDILNQIKS
jgi:thioredoxin-related protein